MHRFLTIILGLAIAVGAETAAASEGGREEPDRAKPRQQQQQQQQQQAPGNVRPKPSYTLGEALRLPPQSAQQIASKITAIGNLASRPTRVGELSPQASRNLIVAVGYGRADEVQASISRVNRFTSRGQRLRQIRQEIGRVSYKLQQAEQAPNRNRDEEDGYQAVIAFLRSWESTPDADPTAAPRQAAAAPGATQRARPGTQAFLDQTNRLVLGDVVALPPDKARRLAARRVDDFRNGSLTIGTLRGQAAYALLDGAIGLGAGREAVTEIVARVNDFMSERQRRRAIRSLLAQHTQALEGIRQRMQQMEDNDEFMWRARIGGLRKTERHLAGIVFFLDSWQEQPMGDPTKAN